MTAATTTGVAVTLVRHGAVADDGRVYGQRRDPALSPAGVGELRALRARWATGWPLADPRTATVRVLRSPARRAAQTAELLEVAADTATAWAERDLGAWEGRPWAEVWTEAPAAVLTDPAAFVGFTPPDAEPVATLRARVADALESLRRGPSDVLVVTHAGPITAAVAHCLGLDDATATRVRIATGTATRLTGWPDGSWTLDAVGA